MLGAATRRADYEVMRPPIRRVLETALYIEDLPAARAFYAGVLGFPILLETPRLIALDAGEQTVLLLFQRGMTTEPLETPGGVIPAHDASGQQHLAFAIAPDAVEPWAAHLVANGIAIESRVRWPKGGESLYVRDPEGHSVELATPGLWATY